MILSSWLPVTEGSEFSLQNLPYGVFSPISSGGCLSSRRRCGTVLGETVIDLSLLEEAQLFDDITISSNMFREETLNPFLEQRPAVWRMVRQRLVDLLDANSNNSQLRDNGQLQKAAFYALDSVTLHLPIQVGEYTDFYSSREHATNVGTMFRGKDNALQPNWLHLPVGYHGRSSTIHVSGHDFCRPVGQLQKNPADPSQGSTLGPCQQLDFELEVAAVVGGPPNQGPMNMAQAKERIFGFMLMNDWSARDIQKWEYVPLGPFTSKNFATTVAPWIVPAEALKAFQVPTSAGRQVNPKPLEYLHDPEYSSYDIRLTVAIQPEHDKDSHIISTSNFSHLYWNPPQQLVHHSVTGCTMRAGDLLGSGTISGTEPTSFGSMLELSWQGTKEVPVGSAVRKFLQDGDTVIMQGSCQKEGFGAIGFGRCQAKVLPPITKISSRSGYREETVVPRYTNFRLHGFWRSSSTWRVRLALHYKSIPFQNIPVDLAKKENEAVSFTAVNKAGQVPVLECTDTQTGRTIKLTQSVAIIDFLEDIVPHKSLYPVDVEHKAKVREMVQIVNSGIQPLQSISYLERLEQKSNGSISAVDEAREACQKGLAHLEDLANQLHSDFGGVYCAGTFSPSLADFYVFPQLVNARRYKVDVDQLCPTLVSIESASKTAPWYKSSAPDATV